jgi:hypothetical protein
VKPPATKRGLFEIAEDGLVLLSVIKNSGTTGRFAMPVVAPYLLAWDDLWDDFILTGTISKSKSLGKMRLGTICSKNQSEEFELSRPILTIMFSEDWKTVRFWSDFDQVATATL